jgi:hypothetical protein
MVNKRLNKELWNFWLSKTESKEMQDALFDNDLDKAVLIFIQSFREGMVEKR